MEITIKSITLYAAIILTGLSAGLFYAWEFSVIPGTRQVKDNTYIETMQAINRAIINPAFMTIFLGSVLVQIMSTYQHRGTTIFWILLIATLTYVIGTILVTGLGNVPLNNALDTLHLKELSPEQITVKRINYELRWNRLHTIRTVFAVISFMLLLWTAFTSTTSAQNL
jgi:uncharacterized membrane protein